ncbi:MAG: nucleotidyltransferase [Planctomycetes bacterium]|nr:nucleotidyltransferase [Planctomycetota bacterium]
MAARGVVPRDKIAEFCRRHRVRKLSLLRSVPRDDFGPEADIALRIVFRPNARVGLFELNDVAKKPPEYFGGRKVEINTPDSLNQRFRDEARRRPRCSMSRNDPGPFRGLRETNSMRAAR